MTNDGETIMIAFLLTVTSMNDRVGVKGRIQPMIPTLFNVSGWSSEFPWHFKHLWNWHHDEMSQTVLQQRSNKKFKVYENLQTSLKVYIRDEWECKYYASAIASKRGSI